MLQFCPITVTSPLPKKTFTQKESSLYLHSISTHLSPVYLRAAHVARTVTCAHHGPAFVKGKNVALGVISPGAKGTAETSQRRKTAEFQEFRRILARKLCSHKLTGTQATCPPRLRLCLLPCRRSRAKEHVTRGPREGWAYINCAYPLADRPETGIEN